MRPVIFNGKFYSGTLNGVHRVGDRLIREVDRLLAAMPADERPDVRLMLPAQRDWTPELSVIRLDEQAGGHTQRWEQVALPRLAAGAVLVNLCNLAPIAHRLKIMLLHDAQFLFPDNGYPARRRWGHKLLTPAMARTSARVLTVSQYSRAMLDLTGISRRERTSVLYNGADHITDVRAEPEVLPRFGLVPGRYVLLFGSDKRYKNVHVVTEAFASPALADLMLVVLASTRAELERAGVAVPPGTVFVGKVSDEILRALYEEAACLAFPSRTEGFGLPPVEAMLVGCPVVQAPAGALPEVGRDAALYADVDYPQEWVDAIRRLVDDPALRAAKVAQGRERAAVFTWARAGRTLLTEVMALASAG